MSRSRSMPRVDPAESAVRCPAESPPRPGGVATRRDILRGAGLGISALGVARADPPAASAKPWSRRVVAGGSRSEATTLVIGSNRPPSDLDPHSAYDAGSTVVLQGPFETLIRVEPGTTDRFRPLIARSWGSSDDGRVWTFHLHEGVAFHDGTPCDAEAVRASFERLFALDYAPASAMRRFVRDATQIMAPDASTVVFDLGRPQPLFEAAVAAPSAGSIVNARLAKQYEDGGDWGHGWAQSTTEGMGTGPYRIVEADPVERTVLERHDAYWRGWDGPHVDRVVLRIVGEVETRRQLIEAGDIDIADNLSPESLGALSANPDIVVDLQYNLTVVYIAMTTVGPLETPSARRAISYAFPYDEVVDGVYEGYAKRAIGPLAERCRGFEPRTFSYQTDLERARGLLAEAGVPRGTTLKMVVPTASPWAGSVAELLGANLERLGLGLEIQMADFATIVAIYYGDMPAEERPHLMPAFWSPDYNDGWNHLWPQVSSASWNSGNAGHYANAEVDALLDQARDAVDEATYQGALSRVQQIVTHDDPAAIYALQPQWPVGLRTDVGGFVPNLVTGTLYDFYALHRRTG